MSTHTTAKVHNPAHDLRVPHTFFYSPIAVQCMYRIIRAHIDKYARVDFRTHEIGYSRWDEVTRSYIRCIMTRDEAQRVFTDLYPAKIVGRQADICITDDCV